jgi:hypothetical protein
LKEHSLVVRECRARKKKRGECLSCSNPSEPNKLNCRECQNYINKNHRQRDRVNKIKCFDHYGRICRCCGNRFDHDAFLTLNHINNDGGKRRKELKFQNFYGWVIRKGYPTDLETNCWNCNSARSVNGGICPHQEKLYGSDTSDSSDASQ